MKIFKNNLCFIILITIAATTVFALTVFASSTNGIIDPTYKYAWGENIGWINFGTSNGNVHVTDSGLSGYALGENVGWIYLGDITNNGEGTLSGYGWGENVGWIKFNPTYGGVIINSSGEFTGSALGENIGWIIFGGDYKVKTDWRPQNSRPACNNASDDDGDGKIDYPNDLGCSSLEDANETDEGGGGLPPAAYNPPAPPPSSPANPQASFKISINQGAEYTNSFTVNLSFIAGQDTARMAISESPDFINGIQIPYQQELKWELLPISSGQISKQGIERTVYVKFFTQYGVASQIFSASIIIDTSLPKTTPAPLISPKVAISEPTPAPRVSTPPQISPIPPQATPQSAPPPYFQIPPDKPEPINPDWNLIKLPEVKNFFPQFNEISFYAQKFPSLTETFKKLGISQIADIISRAPGASFSIPNFREILGLHSSDSDTNPISPFTPTPLANLSASLKEQIPSEIIFVSTASEKINFNSSLVLDEGSLKQKISVPSSTNLNIALKPDQLARSVSGYIALKKSAYTMNTNHESRIKNQDLISMIHDSYFMIQKAIVSILNPSAFAQEVKSQTEPQAVEQRFVLAQFQYSDPDKDGIWTADIQTPAVVGEYEIISSVNYQDSSISSKEIRLIVVIDPEGYVFERIENQELRITNAEVSIYWLNPANNQYELWPAQDYDQKNPQTTDTTGKYSFLVPAGSYYLKAEASGYHPYQSGAFVVSEAGNAHMNLEMKPEWSVAREWKTIAIIGLAIVALILASFLAYNFYEDRRRNR